MPMKRVAAAAAVAAGLGASVTVFHAGFANSVPCPNWQHDKTCDPPPVNQGPGFGGSSSVPNPGSQVPGAGTPRVTTSPPGVTTRVTTSPPGVTTHVTTSPPWSGSSTPSTSPPWSGSSTPSTSPPWSGSSTPSTSAPWSGSSPPSTSAPWSGSTSPPASAPWGTTTQPGERTSYPPTTTRIVLNAPTTQPPHPPYYPPRGPILRGSAQIGGPVDLPGGFYGWRSEERRVGKECSCSCPSA